MSNPGFQNFPVNYRKKRTLTTFQTMPAGTFSRAASKTGTYTQTGTTTVNANVVGHGLAVGDRIYLDFTTGTGVDGATTVLTTPSPDTFTCLRTSLTTSGNVTMYPPLIVTITSQKTHGLVLSALVYITYSATFTSGIHTVFQPTANTFQVDPANVTNVGSGTVNLPSIVGLYTFRKDPKAVAWRITVQGGGSQGQVNSVGFGSGGSAGGKAIRLITNPSLIKDQEVITVGPGGCLATVDGAGTTGGTSSFGSLVSATGGTNVITIGGPGGSGVGGDINLTGSAGGSTVTSRGAESTYGGGGPIATNAVDFGSGGGGANSGGGFFGFRGIVEVEEFFA